MYQYVLPAFSMVNITKKGSKVQQKVKFRHLEIDLLRKDGDFLHAKLGTSLGTLLVTLTCQGF